LSATAKGTLAKVQPGELAEAVQALRWYHRIELPGGVVTAGYYDPRRVLDQLRLPDRLDGKSVLDIGAWDGFFSFAMAQRGARVLATDSVAWNAEEWSGNRGFRLARQALQLDVDDMEVAVPDIAAETVGTHDIVLLLGVLYHLKDPITAIERVAAVTRELLVIETETALTWLPFAAGRLLPGAELGHDPSNWWQLNPAAIRGLLRRCGFDRVEVIYRTPVVRRLGRSARHWRDFRATLRSARIIVHARRSVDVSS
jgi:tRNA (mo5U34)-methyltransferase